MIIRDGDWTLYDSDIKLGRFVWVKHEPNGAMTFRTDYRVDPTVEINKAQRNLAQDNWKGDYHHVASVPLNIFHEQLAEATQQDDNAYLSKWLNDSDNRAWRTKNGNV